MDISYLLFLQNLREGAPSFFEQFFVYLSYIGDGPALIALVLIVYWCIDKRAGQFSFIAFGFGNFVNQLLKNICCVYRPWIRSSEIVPAEAAIEGAGGYSFPSGHTTGTATSLGSFAWLARKDHKWISIVCIVVIVLMMFARNFLGVHTPQDVIVGLVIAIVMIALTQLFFNWLDRYDSMMPGHNKDLIVMIIVVIVCAISVVFIILKPYPMDYVDGNLLVDPVTMQKGSFEAAGICAGLAIAWFLERRLVDFSTDGLDMRARVIRGVIGVVIVGITYVAGDVIFKAILPYNWAKLVQLFCVVIMAVFVAPLVFQKFENGRSASRQSDSGTDDAHRSPRQSAGRQSSQQRTPRQRQRQTTVHDNSPQRRSVNTKENRSR
ncbi:MAG: phosphatase PAP2 family protein [Eggerthellaceae bacterium]|nr:phosphatase PAP2 family protein [Eggerthellaceae bacterium]